MSPKSSSQVSSSETDSECVSSTTVIPPPPESKKVTSTKKVDTAVVSSERSENPAENVSKEENLEVENSLNSDEIPPSDDRPEKPKNSDEVTKEEEEEEISSDHSVEALNYNQIPCDDQSSSKILAHLKPSSSVHVMESHHEQRTTNSESSIGNPLMAEAWENLKKSVVMFKLFSEIPVGTLAALDHSVEALNYNQVFVRNVSPEDPANVFLISLEEEAEKPKILEYLDPDVLTKLLEVLVCQLDREDVLPNLLNLCWTHKTFDMIAKSASFVEFVHERVWEQKGISGGWDSLGFIHRTYRNFQKGISVYSKYSGKESVCSSISILSKHIICGYQSGQIILFEINKGNLGKVSFCPRYQTTKKFHQVAWTVVGFIPDDLDNPVEVVFGSFNGCILSLNFSKLDISVIHQGNHELEGTMIDFAGSKNGWIGLYVGKPNLSFKVWNANREVIFRGSNFMGLDAATDLSLRAGGTLGRVRVIGKSVIACSTRGILSFDINHPEIIQHQVLPDGRFLPKTFNCNMKFCEVHNTNDEADTYLIKNLKKVSKSFTAYRDRIHNRYVTFGPVFASALNDFFKAWVYTRGGGILLGADKCLKKKLVPGVKKVKSVSLDHKCLVVATGDGGIHLWHFEYFSL